MAELGLMLDGCTGVGKAPGPPGYAKASQNHMFCLE